MTASRFGRERDLARPTSISSHPAVTLALARYLALEYAQAIAVCAVYLNVPELLVFNVSKFVVCVLSTLFSTAVLAETELAIIVAVPESMEKTDSFFRVCDEDCLAHGYDVVRVDLEVTEVLLGSIDKGRMMVEATDGYLRHNSRASRDNRHLFVLRKLPEDVDSPPSYFVAEADPILGTACTVFPIEDYLSNAVWLSIETPFAPAKHCYTLREISQLIGNQPD